MADFKLLARNLVDFSFDLKSAAYFQETADFKLLAINLVDFSCDLKSGADF